MKVVVQIPCLNEAATLPLVLKSIPRKIPGVDEIIVVVIDDGCTDQTVAVAKKHGVKQFVHHTRTKGLARSFQDGIMRGLELGADVIVNTDGDNQYPQERITDLVQPVLRGEADIVIADRQVAQIEHFSFGKKIMQKLGTGVLNMAAGTNVPDAPSGFRAYSREAAIRLNIVTKFSYTMETIIQAGNKQLTIASIPVETNPKTRQSRLFKSNWEHVRKSASAILRAFVMYRPYVVFVSLGLFLLLAGLIPVGRFLYFFLFEHQQSHGHTQSLIVGSVLLVGSFIAFALGIIADLTRINRALTEDALEYLKRSRFDKT